MAGSTLFGKILSELNPFFEADGIYILPVGGFGFRPYFEILDALEISLERIIVLQSKKSSSLS